MQIGAARRRGLLPRVALRVQHVGEQIAEGRRVRRRCTLAEKSKPSKPNVGRVGRRRRGPRAS